MKQNATEDITMIPFDGKINNMKKKSLFLVRVPMVKYIQNT